ncbi:MAG: plasmid recombination protein [Bacilli bacterium]|nr:plasmid recombination protein [Bacilli bacterium]
MTSVYTKQVEDLELLVPNFKVASAIIHYDETSPHMHVVGGPIKYKNKYGLSKQVGKSDVFTKSSLTKLQDKMRTLCIEEFNKEYNLNHSLKKKQKGRNHDYLISEMDNYIEMKKGIEKYQKDLEVVNNKSLALDKNSNKVKEIIDNLKPTLTNKEKYVIKQEDKDKIINFLEQVNNTNLEYKKVQELSITLNNVDEELNNNRDKIKTLTENNNALSLRVSTLENKIDKKDEEIEELKEENNSLRSTLNYFKTKFVRLIRFIKDKIFSKKDTREKYMDFSRDLYIHGIIDDKKMLDLKDNYDYLKKNDNKDIEKDDFDISI